MPQHEALVETATPHLQRAIAVHASAVVHTEREGNYILAGEGGVPEFVRVRGRAQEEGRESTSGRGLSEKLHLTGRDTSRKFDLPRPSCPSRPPPHTNIAPSLVMAAQESNPQNSRTTRCCTSSCTRRGRGSTAWSTPSTRPWPSCTGCKRETCFMR